jgi:long-chain acyl-CoA synthetase
MELYERWLETCAENREAWAIRDLGTGVEWSYGDLAEALAARPALVRGSVVTAGVGNGTVEFVVRTLQAWRDGAVLLPVEGNGGPEDSGGGEPPEGIVHVKTTSGSTGEPRRVLFEASQLVADFEQIRDSMRLSREAPNLAVISMAHSYGFSNLVLPLLLGGMPVMALPDPLPGTVRRALETGLAVTLPAVPAMWRAWHQSGLLRGARLACAITAGAPMPLELETSIFERDGIKVHNFYGSSECGGIAFDDSDEPRSCAEEAGRPMKGVALSVGAEGCLAVRSAAVARGYEPEGDRLGGGVFQTSDLAKLEQGRVYLEGRLTDTIHVAGRKIAPQVIEAVLLRHPGVRHCVVFGVASQDSARVEEVVACVNAASGISQAVLQAEVGTELPGWQVPRRWWLTEDLVPDGRGKFSRSQWRERFLRVAGK